MRLATLRDGTRDGRLVVVSPDGLACASAPVPTMQQALVWNPIDADDGWYIDDVQITNRLLNASTVTVDTANRSGLPACGPACSTVTASLLATPSSMSEPGQETVLDASASVADVCPGGPLLYRFWVDADENGSVGDLGDVLLRSWTDDPILTDSPEYTKRYVVEVRCSSRQTCAGTASAIVSVPCPSDPPPFPGSIWFESFYHLDWEPGAARVDVVRGDLNALRGGGGQFDGTAQTCLASHAVLPYVLDFEEPARCANSFCVAQAPRMLERGDDSAIGQAHERVRMHVGGHVG